MRKLHPLIKNQGIRIDNHKRGDGSPLTAKGIHIHKETKIPLEGKLHSVEIEVPLNSTSKVKIFSNKTIYEQIPRVLKKEIQEAFQDKTILEDFVIAVLETLSQCEGGLTKNKAFEAIENISKYFDLKWDAKNVETRVKNRLGDVNYKALIKDIEDHTCYDVTLYPRSKEITINDLMRKDFPEDREE